VKWGLTRDILLAWVLTLPAAALVGGVFAVLSRMIFGAG
jgi:phosphate/sulfate permease